MEDQKCNFVKTLLFFTYVEEEGMTDKNGRG